VELHELSTERSNLEEIFFQLTEDGGGEGVTAPADPSTALPPEARAAPGIPPGRSAASNLPPGGAR
jgi:hypothetical protein